MTEQEIGGMIFAAIVVVGLLIVLSVYQAQRDRIR